MLDPFQRARFPLLLACLLPLAGCGDPPLPDLTEPGEILDAACEGFSGGREALAAETGFHIRGTMYAEGQPNLPMTLEQWRRYEDNRWKEIRASERAHYYRESWFDGQNAYNLDGTTGRQTQVPRFDPDRLRVYQPRYWLLWRENLLTLKLEGIEPLPELDGIRVYRVSASDPSGRDALLFVSTADRQLRKFQYSDPAVGLVGAVFRRYRDPDEVSDPGPPYLLEAEQWTNHAREFRILWDFRESSPDLPDSLFSGPSRR